MRWIIIVAIGIMAGCTSNESTAPSFRELSVGSMTIAGPDNLKVPDSVQLTVAVFDVAAKPVFNRPLTFASSDTRIATVDRFGFVRTLAEGIVTITASSESQSADKVLRILAEPRCSTQDPKCIAGAERYVLVSVNDQALPVRSPWGAGEWDYDEDAGTWKVTHAEVILFEDGYYTYMTFHRAASGATSDFSFGGRYERAPGSVAFYPDGSVPSSSTVSTTGLVERWSTGMTFVYEQRPFSTTTP